MCQIQRMNSALICSWERPQSPQIWNLAVQSRRCLSTLIDCSISVSTTPLNPTIETKNQDPQACKGKHTDLSAAMF